MVEFAGVYANDHVRRFFLYGISMRISRTGGNVVDLMVFSHTRDNPSEAEGGVVQGSEELAHMRRDPVAATPVVVATVCHPSCRGLRQSARRLCRAQTPWPPS